MSNGLVGAVVIGRNEGDRLTSCLRSLAGATENLVYVDSGSSDNSVENADRLGAYVVQLDAARSFSAARARNAGYEALKQVSPNIEFVQFVDGDCEIVEGWIGLAVEFLTIHPDVAVVCGRRREKDPRVSIYNLMMDIEWTTPIGETLACGGDCLMRAGAFEAVGGYRASLIAGEEPELCSRLRQFGWRVYRLDVEMTKHDAAMTRFSQYWRRSVRAGYAEAEVSALHFRDGLGRSELKQTVRAVFWGALLPAAIIIGSFVSLLALLALVAYPIQIVRVAIRKGWIRKESWIYSALIVVTKFAQVQGVARFVKYQFVKKNSSIIEYKLSE